MQDQELNARLKRMWAISEKLDNNIDLDIDEKLFWNTHLKEIQDYYNQNASMWRGLIKIGIK